MLSNPRPSSLSSMVTVATAGVNSVRAAAVARLSVSTSSDSTMSSSRIVTSTQRLCTSLAPVKAVRSASLKV